MEGVAHSRVRSLSSSKKMIVADTSSCMRARGVVDWRPARRARLHFEPPRALTAIEHGARGVVVGLCTHERKDVYVKFSTALATRSFATGTISATSRAEIASTRGRAK